MAKIYTKTGDKGITTLADRRRVKKTSVIIKLYGELDELNSFLGWAQEALHGKVELESVARLIYRLQQEIFTISTFLTSRPTKGDIKKEIDMDELIFGLEENIDNFRTKLSTPIKSFVLPGGGEIASRLHIARVVCRRAERTCFHVVETEAEPVATKVTQIAVYLNRLSDLLYVLTCVAAAV